MTHVANWIINLITHTENEQQPADFVWQPDTNLQDASVRLALTTSQME